MTLTPNLVGAPVPDGGDGETEDDASPGKVSVTGRTEDVIPALSWITTPSAGVVGVRVVS